MPSPRRRTNMGCMRPFSLIDSASSESSSSENVLRGWYRFGMMCSMRSSCTSEVWTAASFGAAGLGSSASNPLPSAFFSTAQYLLREIEIRLSTGGSGVVEHDRTPITRCFRQRDIPRDQGLVDLFFEMASYFLRYLPGQTIPRIEPRQND